MRLRFSFILIIFAAGTFSLLPSQFSTQLLDYPIIKNKLNECIKVKSGYQFSETMICDPDKLLNSDEIDRLHRFLHEIKENVNYGSEPCTKSKPQAVMGIALVDAMHLGDDGSDKDKLLDYAAIFTYNLFDRWELESTCKVESNKAVIFYSKADGALYTFVGKVLEDKFPTKVLVNTAVETKASFKTSVYSGLTHLLRQYKEILAKVETTL